MNLLCYSPDGRQIAGSSWANEIHIWSALKGKSVRVLRGHQEIILAIAFSPDGTRLASASMDKTVRLWNAATGEQLAVLHGHESGVRCLAFSSDGTQVVSGSFLDSADANEFHNSLRVWDVETASEVSIICEPRHQFLQVAFSPDNLHVLAEANDVATGQFIGTWDISTGERIEAIEGSGDFTRTVKGELPFRWRNYGNFVEEAATKTIRRITALVGSVIYCDASQAMSVGR